MKDKRTLTFIPFLFCLPGSSEPDFKFGHSIFITMMMMFKFPCCPQAFFFATYILCFYIRKRQSTKNKVKNLLSVPIDKQNPIYKRKN